MDKRAVEQVGLTCSTALSLIHHLIKRIAERLCRPTVHFVQANLRYLVRLSTKRMRDGGDLRAGSAALRGQESGVCAGDQALAYSPAQGLHGVGVCAAAVPEGGQGAIPAGLPA